MQSFFSHGKLLLTAEYLVLRGAKALALPVVLGQSLQVQTEEAGGNPHINWFALAPGKPWFKAAFELPSMDIIGTDDRKKSAKLQLILLTLQQLQPQLFSGKYSFRMQTQLDFEPEWGLGSSSTLIANLAKWAGVDPYTLLQFSVGGSGYDIACALAKGPVIYQLDHLRPKSTAVTFSPPFADKLFFVYRGQKKDSAQGIRSFNELTENSDLSAIVEQFSALTEQLAQSKDFDTFCVLMEQHEQLLSGLLLQSPVKTNFPDFKGKLKSLGAWGGDFMLAMSEEGTTAVKDYFKGKGLNTVFEYHELVLSESKSKA